MHLPPTQIILFAFFAFALASLPGKYRPKWFHRLRWWQILIGAIATIAALLIIMSPEFYALGLLGDSAFFDLLAVAIGVQLQGHLTRIGAYLAAGAAKTARFIHWRYAVVSTALAICACDIASTVQRL